MGRRSAAVNGRTARDQRAPHRRAPTSTARRPSAFLTVRCPHCGPVETRLGPCCVSDDRHGSRHSTVVTVTVSGLGDDLCAVACECGTVVREHIDAAMSALLVASGATIEITCADGANT